MYWSLLVQHRHTDSPRQPWTTQVGLHWEMDARIKAERLWNAKWGEPRRLATCICQQEPQSLFCMCCHHHYPVHRQNKLHRQEKEPRTRKIPADLWPPGDRRGLPRMHTEEVQTEFMTALSPSPPSSPLHPSVDTRSHCAGADRPGITHSLPS